MEKNRILKRSISPEVKDLVKKLWETPLSKRLAQSLSELVIVNLKEEGVYRRLVPCEMSVIYDTENETSSIFFLRTLKMFGKSLDEITVSIGSTRKGVHVVRRTQLTYQPGKGLYVYQKPIIVTIFSYDERGNAYAMQAF